MKFVVILAGAMMLVSFASSDIPNVYEFCTALMTDKPASSCSCRSRPGKKGIPGVKGDQGPIGVTGNPGIQGPQGIPGLAIKGSKGEKGDQGSVANTAALEKQVELLQVAFCSMGMKSGAIPDSAITVSSSWISSYRGKYARLDMDDKNKHYGGWHPAYGQLVGSWIQIDLGSPTSISGLITQGRPGCCDQWTTSYRVKCGNSPGSTFKTLAGTDGETFNGNTDRDTKVTNMFQTPVTCRFIKIYPQTWNNYPLLRLEFLRGECFNFY